MSHKLSIEKILVNSNKRMSISISSFIKATAFGMIMATVSLIVYWAAMFLASMYSGEITEPLMVDGGIWMTTCMIGSVVLAFIAFVFERHGAIRREMARQGVTAEIVQFKVKGRQERFVIKGFSFDDDMGSTCTARDNEDHERNTHGGTYDDLKSPDGKTTAHGKKYYYINMGSRNSEHDDVEWIKVREDIYKTLKIGDWCYAVKLNGKYKSGLVYKCSEYTPGLEEMSLMGTARLIV